jgi:hypothetical protein
MLSYRFGGIDFVDSSDEAIDEVDRQAAGVTVGLSGLVRLCEVSPEPDAFLPIPSAYRERPRLSSWPPREVYLVNSARNWIFRPGSINSGRF